MRGKIYQRITCLLLTLLMGFGLSGCVQDLAPLPLTGGWQTPDAAAAAVVQQPDSVAGTALPAAMEELAPSPSARSYGSSQGYAFKQEMIEMFNKVLADYASGALPESVSYNANYSSISNKPPRDVTLPAEVALSDVEFDIRYGEYLRRDYIVVSLPLENEFVMDVHIDTDDVDMKGRPQRTSAVYFFDMQGTKQLEEVDVGEDGRFLFLRNDRLYASVDFDYVRTNAGRVSGSLSWGKANGLLWIDIDSMKEPFFYTYSVNIYGGITQDYPQKDWQRTDVINDDKMMMIAQSLFGTLTKTLEANDLPVGLVPPPPPPPPPRRVRRVTPAPAPPPEPAPE